MLYLRQVIYESVDQCVPPQYSFVRGFQTLSKLPPVDVYFNNMLRARNFKYKDMTPYMPSASELYNVQFFLTGTKDNPLVDIKDLKVERGQIITFATIGSASDIKLLPIIDDINENIRFDETKIRFYNFDSTPITFSMSIPSGSVTRSLASGQGTNYNLIDPGSYRFEVLSPNPNIRPISMKIDLKPGRIYTLYVAGSLDPGSEGYSYANIPQVILSVDGNTVLKKCVFFSP